LCVFSKDLPCNMHSGDKLQYKVGFWLVEPFYLQFNGKMHLGVQSGRLHCIHLFSASIASSTPRQPLTITKYMQYYPLFTLILTFRPPLRTVFFPLVLPSRAIASPFSVCPFTSVSFACSVVPLVSFPLPFSKVRFHQCWSLWTIVFSSSPYSTGGPESCISPFVGKRIQPLESVVLTWPRRLYDWNYNQQISLVTYLHVCENYNGSIFRIGGESRLVWAEKLYGKTLTRTSRRINEM